MCFSTAIHRIKNIARKKNIERKHILELCYDTNAYIQALKKIINFDSNIFLKESIVDKDAIF